MSKNQAGNGLSVKLHRVLLWTLFAVLSFSTVSAQTPAATPKAGSTNSAQSPNQSQDQPQTQPATQVPTHISPDQAKELFKSVDDLLSFASAESGLPIHHEVKRKLITRAEIEADLKQRFEDDKDAKRMQRSEIVLKKFGLLDRDFNLRPFLLSLLSEQIAGYYDAKTRTVNLLDWLDADSQKPVLAHELTHALQDQHTDLKKWGDQTPTSVARNHHEDLEHIERDEMDDAREAVLEGQATAVFTDYLLKPLGKSLINDPEVVDLLKNQFSATDADSPIMARAPLLLSESMLFPYRDGLGFEQDVWMDQGREAAFAGALDHPPTSTWEIFNPLEFEKHHVPAIPQMADFHPLLDRLYKPYDIGQIGQLDLQILLELFGGKDAARDLTPAWDGGLYWAGARRDATEADLATTRSVALFYLSAWKNSDTAKRFAEIYAGELGQKYSGLKRNEALSAGATEVYVTNEGPVTITTRGRLVFVTESIPLDVAAKLTTEMLDAQGTGELKQAQLNQNSRPALALNSPASVVSEDAPRDSLTGSFVRFFSSCGVMKFVLDAGKTLR
jgi:hypothetical protein